MPWNVKWINDFYAKKEEILKSKSNSQKIIIFGGSCTLFSVKAKLIQTIMNIPAVNFGIASGVQTDYLFHRIYRLEKYLNKDDIIILPLEYSFLLYDGSPSKIKGDLIRTYDKAFFRNMPVRTQLQILLKTNFANMIKDNYKSIKYKNRRSKINYDPDATNEYGDQIHNHGNQVFIKKFYANYYAPIPIQNNSFEETVGLTLIKKFNLWCKSKDLKLYVSFAATVNFTDYLSDKYSQYFEFILKFYKKNNISTIGSPYDFLYEPEYFYDTRYHLNTEGAVNYTQQLIEKLKNKL